MITVKVDTSGLGKQMSDFVGSGGTLAPVFDTVIRQVATSMLGVVKNRIHEEGKDAAGAQIGNYTPGYMAVRTGQFKSNGVKSKGKNKGETKPTGVFTKGKNKGGPRPNYNRTGDTKVVISLTRQMENDFVVMATDNGYGLGYNNPDNRKKVDYVEATYGKKIFALTPDEEQQSVTIAKTELNNAIS